MSVLRFLPVALGLCLLSIGCPPESPPAPLPTPTPPTPQQPYQDLGALQDAIADARNSTDPAARRDTDGDGIPDVVEQRLGTDPADADSDHDGLADGVELFGSGEIDRAARLPDQDGDGEIAPIDPDDDGDGINDGELVDSDADGIANYLEYYGYRYDWLTGVFIPWDGNPATVYYRTDPLQVSTDQDAFSDSMEVTGIGLDVSIEPPGDHPLVPAVPNIVMELVGYSVTLNEEITYQEGHSLARGQTWNRETEQSSSQTDERNWETGVEAGYASGSVQVLVHANYGESYSNTQSTSTAVAVGGSVLDESQWSTARSVNPTDAARLKLFVRVHNLGGAPVSSVIPTLTVKIGGLGVATFEPGNAQINMLVPGQSYPSDPAVTWVIDSIDTGAGIVPISLTMRELRALESGAPVSITVTQLLGDVMRLDADGVWQRVGDVNQYLARCDAVSANLYVDLGDGNFVHHLVYADDSVSAPRVTIGDALALIGLDDQGVLHFIDRGQTPRSVSLDGYSFVVDGQTLRHNGWQVDVDQTSLLPPVDFDFADIRLYPASSVLARAPRTSVGVSGPVIHYAYIDYQLNEIKACATDYQGVALAEVVSADGSRRLALAEDLPGAGYFSGAISGAPFDADELLKLVVTNRSDVAVERELGSLFVQPGPRLPIIRAVSLDLANHRIYANVESGAPDDPASEIEWVRAYHPGLDGGAVDMTLVIDSYRDPNGFAAELPATFANANIEVVAFVAPGVFATHLVSVTEVQAARRYGSMTLGASIDTTGEDEEWWVPYMDLDEGTASARFYEADDWSTSYNPAAPADIWLMVGENASAYMFFNTPYVRVAAGTDFTGLSRDQIDALNPSDTATLQAYPSADLYSGDVIALRTTSGRYTKIRITGISHSDDATTNYYARWVAFDYVTFALVGE